MKITIDNSAFPVRRSARLLHGVACLFSGAVLTVGAAPVSFTRDLAPILADKCLDCHHEKKAKGKYRVDSYEMLRQAGGSKETSVTPGKPDQSTLFTRLVSGDEDERMPQKGDALSVAQIELFKRWIAAGAQFDGGDAKSSLGDLLQKKAISRAPEKYPRPLPVTALAPGEDGALVFTGGYRELLEWSFADGKLTRRIPAMPERVLAISLQPKGPNLVVAGGTPGRSGEVLVVARQSGAVLRKLVGARDTFLAATFSPDGTLLALGGTDNTVRVFRSRDWKLIWKAEAHADWVMSLAFTPDGKHLASTSRDRTARVFEAESGEIAFTFVDHQSAVLCAVFDSEGDTVITGAADGEVRRWAWWETDAENKDKKDSKDKKPPRSAVLKSKRQEVTAMAVSGESLFTGSSDGQLRVYNLKQTGDPTELESLGSRVLALQVDVTGSKLFISGQGGEVRVLDLAQQGRLIAKFEASPGCQSAP